MAYTEAIHAFRSLLIHKPEIRQLTVCRDHERVTANPDLCVGVRRSQAGLLSLQAAAHYTCIVHVVNNAYIHCTGSCKPTIHVL